MKRYIPVFLSAIIILGTSCSHRQTPYPIGAERIQEFKRYYIMDYSMGTVCPHGFITNQYLEYPIACSDSSILIAIQQTIDSVVFRNEYLWHDIGSMPVWDSIQRPQLYWNVNELYEMNGTDNWWHQNYLITVFNQDSIYTIRHHWSYYEGGAHPWEGDRYISFHLHTGRRMDLEDFFSPQECDSIFRSVPRAPHLEGEDFEQEYVRKRYSCGYTEQGVLLHYNSGILDCEAAGAFDILVGRNTP